MFCNRLHLDRLRHRGKRGLDDEICGAVQRELQQVTAEAAIPKLVKELRRREPQHDLETSAGPCCRAYRPLLVEKSLTWLPEAGVARIALLRQPSASN